MRAIVLKNHYDSTAGLAYLVRKVVPGIEVFGGIDLNLTVGGINPPRSSTWRAVTGGWGRIVWMPTFDAENQVRVSKENRPFVPRVAERRAAAGGEGGHRASSPSTISCWRPGIPRRRRRCCCCARRSGRACSA